MTIPMYVSPEQFMKDRADYARKGIARGRSVVVLSCREGILFVAENPSSSLHKVSEIYDRIGFAAVGKYTEFEHLRVAGIRYADLRGYSYDRSDVTARALANAYAQTLGQVFTTESKPYEVEITVAQVGPDPAADQLYRLTYDGSVSDEPGLVAMGGAAEGVAAALADGFDPTAPLDVALRRAVAGLARAGGRELGAADLEVALLDRARPRRAFRRIPGPEVETHLAAADGSGTTPTDQEG
ncbi:proteasome subunit alpha [Ornithinimicrobium humiphilum]|uniref:Proteasome subunit alpha n=1 Tax=Ornithinimicrobium humiphilum TaxID=125288 RepID=A0A543KP72_9MICO|nr:proteasome subunit alpha [Ornithinimicrobium humiphilum]TQM96872.1 proteasome alpha subunit [Ornithinimicrobium humiphilum]